MSPTLIDFTFVIVYIFYQVTAHSYVISIIVAQGLAAAPSLFLSVEQVCVRACVRACLHACACMSACVCLVYWYTPECLEMCTIWPVLSFLKYIQYFLSYCKCGLVKVGQPTQLKNYHSHTMLHLRTCLNVHTRLNIHTCLNIKTIKILCILNYCN